MLHDLPLVRASVPTNLTMYICFACSCPSRYPSFSTFSVNNESKELKVGKRMFHKKYQCKKWRRKRFQEILKFGIFGHLQQISITNTLPR